MKIIAYIVLCAVLFLPITALATETPDQVCVGNPFDEGRAISVQLSLNGQVFVPTLNHIKKVAIFAKAVNGSTAKVKLKIQKAWWNSNMPTYEKTIVINSDAWWYEANFGEASVEPGVAYFLTVEPQNNAMIQWYLKEDPNCNPSGYAFVSGKIEREKDFYFSVRSEDQIVQLEAPVDTGSQEGVTENDNATPTPTTITTQTSQPDSSTSSQQSGQSSTSTRSDKTSQDITKSDVVGSNKSVASSSKLSDEEVEQILAMIAQDYKANHKTGAFGLGGVVGRILTWPVFYSLAGLILLTILITVIIRARKRTYS